MKKLDIGSFIYFFKLKVHKNYHFAILRSDFKNVDDNIDIAASL